MTTGVRGLAMPLLSTALLVVACAAPRPTVVVPLEISWEGDFELLIFDASGLVTGARQVQQPFDGPSSATARPDQSAIDVSWIGGACSHQPTARISGTAEVFRIALANTPDTNPFSESPVACPDVGLAFTVTLSLSAPVQQAAITFEFTP